MHKQTNLEENDFKIKACIVNMLACMLMAVVLFFCFKGMDSPPMLGELRTIPVDEEWYSLGQALGISVQELENIQKTEPNAFKCKAQMFRLWLQNDPVASWEKLATALQDINKTDLASEVQSHHWTDAEIVSSGYESVESSISSVLWNKGSDENDNLKHDKPNLVRKGVNWLLVLCCYEPSMHVRV